MFLLEISANTALVAAVFLAARNHWTTWPTGIVGCLLFAVLFYKTKLYADVTLQIFFVMTSLAGWKLWQRTNKDAPERAISRSNPKLIFGIFFPLAIVTALAYGTLLAKTTDAHFPIIDSLVLTFSVVAQFLLMGRKLETWFFWIIVNIIAIPLYATKGLYLTSGVYAAFLINAIYGYYNWHQDIKKNNAG